MNIFYYSHLLKNALAEVRGQGKTIGYVPTMGALHSGHASLIQQAMEECDTVLANIFVNPRQFNNPEDFAKYPNTLDQDMHLLENLGCDMVFKPETADIYPPDFKPVFLDLGSLDKVFEGFYRPGHFDGVVQVLYRLFDIVQPDKAYFGLKDYQQCMVVKKLAAAYFPNLQIILCDTLRETDGLAMSSRNMRLSTTGRSLAPALFRAMQQAAASFLSTSVAESKQRAISALQQQGIEVEYFEIADPDTLLVLNTWQEKGRHIILAAIYIEGVRLIDNLIF